MVTVVRNGAALRKRWERCPSYAKMRPFLDTEVQARQHLNCEVAMSMALSPETEAGLVDGNLVEVECSADRNGKANGNADGGRNGVPQNAAADWLLHIDSDELFHIGEGTVHDHLQISIVTTCGR